MDNQPAAIEIESLTKTYGKGRLIHGAEAGDGRPTKEAVA